MLAKPGVVIKKRHITDLTNRGYEPSHLPTDEFYFPAAAEFYTGMVTPVNVMMPGMPFYPMGRTPGQPYTVLRRGKA